VKIIVCALPAATVLCVWVVSWVGYFNMMNELTGSGNREFSNDPVYGLW